ncbi:nucleotidyltransferase family protein [Domibacillus sp. PGB-M46]|uniref:nucleotidyltransferase domain-containing protein n=1 Tax=Domibacillus sp. PGB-M46 TaxID=2910255 RepID=UPI001F594E98|nr:nucleotidyltransferase family protein [Domibacillus sp. PGB-M46]MCI2255184.1 nucleotidyltransferase family protein [Domibacillus sp. PGB-M46]
MSKDLTLNLTGIPKELRLILDLLNRKKQEQAQRNRPISFTGIDWALFIEQAKHHRVYPLLFHTLKKFDSAVIPESVQQEIHQDYQFNTFRMLYLSAEMDTVCKEFEKAGIQLLCLKGPVVAQDLYGELSLRTSNDADVLVPIKDIEKAEELMKNMGYEKDYDFKSVLNDWKWRHRHVTYVHPQKKVKVEIHWRLHEGPAKEQSFQELWERRRQSPLGESVYILSKEDLFFFLVSHGARHGWSRLRWLIDIHQLLQQELEWDRVYSLLKKYQYLQVGGQAILLSMELLGTTRKQQFAPFLDQKSSKKLAQEAIFYYQSMINLHADDLPAHVDRYHRRHLFSLKSKRRKFIFILSFLHPYPEDAEVLPLPSHLHFLYFPLRPFLWVWRKTRKPALS